VRDKPDTNIVLVTDALKPTKQAKGPFFANNEEVYLSDKVFLRCTDDVIAREFAHHDRRACEPCELWHIAGIGRKNGLIQPCPHPQV